MFGLTWKHYICTPITTRKGFCIISSLVAGIEGVEVDDKDKEFDGEGSNTVLLPDTFLFLKWQLT